MPILLPKDKIKLEALAQKVLEAHAFYPDSTLADLYDQLTMPLNLRKAHNALDIAVEKLYRPARFENDRERAEFLLAEYEAMTAPLLAVAQAKPKWTRKKAISDSGLSE